MSIVYSKCRSLSFELQLLETRLSLRSLLSSLYSGLVGLQTKLLQFLDNNADATIPYQQTRLISRLQTCVSQAYFLIVGLTEQRFASFELPVASSGLGDCKGCCSFVSRSKCESFASFDCRESFYKCTSHSSDDYTFCSLGQSARRVLAFYRSYHKMQIFSYDYYYPETMYTLSN